MIIWQIFVGFFVAQMIFIHERFFVISSIVKNGNFEKTEDFLSTQQSVIIQMLHSNDCFD